MASTPTEACKHMLEKPWLEYLQDRMQPLKEDFMAEEIKALKCAQTSCTEETAMAVLNCSSTCPDCF